SCRCAGFVFRSLRRPCRSLRRPCRVPGSAASSPWCAPPASSAPAVCRARRAALGLVARGLVAGLPARAG
ncbi:hypothetical protein C3R44_21890, partial [Mycobacterium tuberculosis]